MTRRALAGAEAAVIVVLLVTLVEGAPAHLPGVALQDQFDELVEIVGALTEQLDARG